MPNPPTISDLPERPEDDPRRSYEVHTSFLCVQERPDLLNYPQVACELNAQLLTAQREVERLRQEREEDEESSADDNEETGQPRRKKAKVDKEEEEEQAAQQAKLEADITAGSKKFAGTVALWQTGKNELTDLLSTPVPAERLPPTERYLNAKNQRSELRSDAHDVFGDLLEQSGLTMFVVKLVRCPHLLK